MKTRDLYIYTNLFTLDIIIFHILKKIMLLDLLINKSVKPLKINESYQFGRSRKYDFKFVLTLTLFAYTTSIFISYKVNN